MQIITMQWLFESLSKMELDVNIKFDSCKLLTCFQRRLWTPWRWSGSSWRYYYVVIIAFTYCSFHVSKSYILYTFSDLPGILMGLTKEFNIDKFLTVLLESLLEYRLEIQPLSQNFVSFLNIINDILFTVLQMICAIVLYFQSLRQSQLEV